MLIAVFASVAAEACVGVWGGMCVFVMCVFVMRLFVMSLLVVIIMLVVVGVVWWLDSDLHGDWSFLVDWERDVLLMDDWTIDWHMDVIRHWLFDDVRDLFIRNGDN